MVKILCYHKVSDIRNDYNLINVSVENFREHMRWLSSKFRIIPISEYDLFEKTDENVVLVTFDDGYTDVIENVVPIIEEYGVPITLFITTGNIDTEYENWTDNIIRCIFEPNNYNSQFEWHDDELDGVWDVSSLEQRVSFYKGINYFFRSSNARTRKKFENILLEWAGLNKKGRIDRRIVSSKQLMDISENPLISIGAHCVSHPSLGQIDKDEQEFEIEESVRILKKITGRNIETFAYPFGGVSDYTDDTICILENSGIKKAFTTQGISSNIYGKPKLEIPRFICPNYNLNDFSEWFDSLSRDNASNSSSFNENSKKNITSGSINNNRKLFDKCNLIIWGCGYWGKKLYYDLQLYKISNKVVAFGDNDQDKIGGMMYGLAILGPEQVVEMFEKEEVIVLVKNTCDIEIVNDLISKGIKRIHIISRE